MEGRRRNEIPRGLPAVSCFNVGHQFLQKRSISFLSATSNSTTFLFSFSTVFFFRKLEKLEKNIQRTIETLGFSAPSRSIAS